MLEPAYSNDDFGRINLRAAARVVACFTPQTDQQIMHRSAQLPIS